MIKMKKFAGGCGNCRFDGMKSYPIETDHAPILIGNSAFRILLVQFSFAILSANCCGYR